VTGARDFTLKNVSQALRPSMAGYGRFEFHKPSQLFVGAQMKLFSIATRVSCELLSSARNSLCVTWKVATGMASSAFLQRCARILATNKYERRRSRHRNLPTFDDCRLKREITASWTLGVTCGTSNLTRFQPAEKLPSYRTHSRELRQSNPEIRQMLGFFSRVLTAPSLCVASNVPSHSQKRRKMIVF
jgi:hypothetical protein